ncbi:TetR/AcrR family transcriptional regulator [Halomontanus rarus]|uniref:TetR/AcrR family transcriptional regulator n=2 Tax=Halomontanus rarus TaxID=3034020 RepID=UPI001A99D6D6|nr:TetR/AcrR family transcriptional regulator [Halovivax sp. TS33]
MERSSNGSSSTSDSDAGSSSSSSSASPSPAPEAESTDAREEIMEATYHVLCEEGYAGLTMRAIAAEAGTSKSLIHYHFDTKEELLLTFLERFLDRLDEWLVEIESETDDPEARLLAFVDRFVVQPADADRQAFWRAVLELRLQAAHQEVFREQLKANNDAIRSALASIVADGIEDETFREVDPERTADLVLDALEGARTRQATLGPEEAPLTAREAVREHVIDDIVRE